MIKILTFILFNALTFVTFGQSKIVDLERIESRKLKKSLLQQKLNLADNLMNLMPTCPDAADSSHNFHTATFYFNAPIDSVWNAYKTINPTDAWKGKIVHFGFAYNRADNDFLYQKEAFEGLQEGHIQFLHLRYLGGICRLNIAHEVIAIDEARHSLQFCYLKYGKSQGTQIIHLRQVGDITAVTHDTYYKSNSKFRDKRIYPFFHQKTIQELHANVGKMMAD
jgi:hypothetical protein